MAWVPKIDKNYIFNEHIDDIIEDIKENKKVLLVGHTGTGKTSSILQIAARTNNPVKRVNLNDQITISDLVGFHSAENGNVVFKYGVIPTAMKYGFWLFLDEIDCSDPGILAILNPILEGNPLELKENGGELILPHQNFRVFASANTMGCMQDFRYLYMGTKLMNEAFIDRFRVYYIDYMNIHQETSLLINVFLDYYQSKNGQLTPEKIESNMAQITALCASMVKGANNIRIGFMNGTIENCTFSTRRLIDWLENTIRHQNPIHALKHTVLSKISFSIQSEILNYLSLELIKQEHVKQLFYDLSNEHEVLSPSVEKEKIKEILFKSLMGKIQKVYPNDDAETLKQKILSKEANVSFLETFSTNVVDITKNLRNMFYENKIKIFISSELLLTFIADYAYLLQSNTDTQIIVSVENSFKKITSKADFLIIANEYSKLK